MNSIKKLMSIAALAALTSGGLVFAYDGCGCCKERCCEKRSCECNTCNGCCERRCKVCKVETENGEVEKQEKKAKKARKYKKSKKTEVVAPMEDAMMDSK